MPKDLYEESGGSPQGGVDLYAEERGVGPLKSKVPKKRRTIFEIASDESIPKAERDKLIIERSGWKAEGITESGNYVPGEITDRVLKKTDYSYALGQTRGGTALKGIWEGIEGPVRTLGVGAAHLKEAAGIGKTPSADRRRAEILASIDKQNYDYSTTDETTGKGNFGQTVAPIAGELLASNKVAGLLKGVRGIGALTKLMRNPGVQASVLGALQPSVIEGDQEGGSNFGTNTLKQAVLGGVTGTVATPIAGKILDKAAKSKIGQYLALKTAEGPITLEKLKAALQEKLGGKTPGEVAQEAQRAAGAAKNAELSDAFTRVGRRAKPGDVDTTGIVETIQRHKRKLGREWNLDDPAESYLSELEKRITRRRALTERASLDPQSEVTLLGPQGPRPFSPQGEFAGTSEAGITFPDIMREYKVSGAKMRQAYSKGGQDSAAGALAGERGGLQFDLRSAIQDAARRHDPGAAAEWAKLRDRWQLEYKPFREGRSGELLDKANIDPNKTLDKILADSSGDDLRNLTRIPLPEGTKTALQARKVDEFKNIYDANVARPISPDTVGGGPGGLASSINDPNHATFVSSLGDPGFASDIGEIANRATTASRAGGAINVGGGALVSALAGGSMGGSGVGGVGGLAGAYLGSRLPNYASRPIMRAMENPHIRRAMGIKYGLHPDSPELQKIIDDIMIQGSGLWASREAPAIEDPEEYQ